MFRLYDLEKKRWALCPMPTKLEDGKRVSDTLTFVIAQAKSGHKVAIKALQLITKFNLKGKR